jgi:hypothetical protein
VKLPKTYHAQPINNDAEIEPIDWEAELQQLEAEAEAQIQRENQEREAAKLKAQDRHQSGQISAVDAFNEQNPLESILRGYGYKQSGKRWLSPDSESGQAGVILSSDGRKWISAHGCDADKGRPINNGTMGDAFDLYCFYEWGNDRNAALTAVGDAITTPEGISITKHNQRLYKQREAANECMAGFEDLSQTGGGTEQQVPFSLLKFSLKGRSHEMRLKMLDDVHVLDRMAVLGEFTVFYAKFNTGKTLMTIRFLIDAIENKQINCEDVFYINADDSFRGLTEKLELAEQSGFHMLAPGHNNFNTDDLTVHLQTMVSQDTARGKIIVLDTLKKFADLMDKTKGSKFTKKAREFIQAGGTIIGLAHANKHDDKEGNPIYEGTADMANDADCVYTIKVDSAQAAASKLVTFENHKSRSDVERVASYRYDNATNLTYVERLHSIEKIDNESAAKQAVHKQREARFTENNSIIMDIVDSILAGINTKTELIDEVHRIGAESKQKIKKVLEYHTGANFADRWDCWQVKKGEKNAKIYSVNFPLNARKPSPDPHPLENMESLKS